MNFIPFIEIHFHNFEIMKRFKKNLMTPILFKRNQGLKLYIILCIIHLLIIFIIYQSIHSFSNKWKVLTTKFHKRFPANIYLFKVNNKKHQNDVIYIYIYIYIIHIYIYEVGLVFLLLTLKIFHTFF